MRSILEHSMLRQARLARLFLPTDRRAEPAAPSKSRNADAHIYVDVSVISKHDAQTGIQRVVRAIWMQLCSMDVPGLKVVPIRSVKWRGYCYARADFLDNPNAPNGMRRVEMRAGDIFLGLDLSLRAIDRHRRQLVKWKRAGAAVSIFVYDLLPIFQPDWFTPQLVRRFRKWLTVLASHADQAICISENVRNDLRSWLTVHGARQLDGIDIAHLPLGGDIAASRPTAGIPADTESLFGWVGTATTVLMVGTIEPRKGYAEALDAFEAIWNDPRQPAINLLIVGRPGWMTEGLQTRIESLHSHNRFLRWIKDASDELLLALYERCDFILLASHAEGFGLPIIEALFHAKPVLARDLPVFREIKSSRVRYFSSSRPLEMAQAIVDMRNDSKNIGARSEEEVVFDWRDSAIKLLEILDVAGTNKKNSERRKLCI